MLDQNTDRMWFVIGAVIVGAAIIFIANGTLPDIFASVTESFELQTKQATDVISEIEPLSRTNMMSEEGLVYGQWLNESSGTLMLTANASEYAVSGYIGVVPGKSYRFKTPDVSYDKRIVFFNEDKEGIFGDTATGNKLLLSLKAPNDARYARISTRVHTMDDPLRVGVPVSEWWFGESY